ncbi:MAG: SPASM domain-containing protein [Chloroflexaceae bacterium]|nr:SPASM domain-containing protein [Chloroflexaceae bacterium]
MQRATLEEKGIPIEEHMQLNDTYYKLKDHLEQIVKENNLPPPANRIRRPPMHVNSGNGFIFISQTGQVRPCGYLPLPVGNVRETSLVNIYRDNPTLQSLRDRSALKGRCGECEFYSLCSGSRSRAYALTGDPLEEEEYCIYHPGTFPFTDEAFALSGIEA